MGWLAADPSYAITPLEIEGRVRLEPVISTGVAELDLVLDGGFPRRSCVLVLGGPGTGKTTFAIQFIYRNARERGVKALFIAVDEAPEVVRHRVSAFGWDLRELERTNYLIMYDLHTLIARIPSDEFFQPEGPMDVASFLAEILGIIDEFEVEVLAVDTVTTLLEHFGGQQTRLVLKRMLSALRYHYVTALFTADLVSRDRQLIHAVEYEMDGILHLFLEPTPDGIDMIRYLRIEKMKGRRHPLSRIPMRITTDGIHLDIHGIVPGVMRRRRWRRR